MTINICPNCKNLFTGNGTYCSETCFDIEFPFKVIYNCVTGQFGKIWKNSKQVVKRTKGMKAKKFFESEEQWGKDILDDHQIFDKENMIEFAEDYHKHLSPVDIVLNVANKLKKYTKNLNKDEL